MKWKLIKTYPGFKKLGVIASDEEIKNPDHLGIRHDVGTYTFYPKELVIDNPEFWEEVKEKEYTILSFISKDGLGRIFNRKDNGQFYLNDKEDSMRINEEVGIEYHTIFSVRREKDGEIFTLGDLDVPSLEPITSITINEDYGGIALRGRKFTQGLSHAKKAIPPRKPILVTEDGKEMFDGDNYSLFSVLTKANWQELRCSIKHALEFSAEWKHFHTKEKREEYIKWNKPMYSLNDVKVALDKDKITPVVIRKLEKLDRK